MSTLQTSCKLGSLTLVVALFSIGCSDRNNGLLYRCSDKLLSEQLSPEKSLIAQSYERNCGATTDFSTIIVIRKNHHLSQQGLPAITAAAKGRVSVDIKWISESQIKIKSSSPFVNKKDRSNNVEIIYEQSK